MHTEPHGHSKRRKDFNNMKKTFFIALTAILANGLFADAYSDMAKYKAGDSIAWFYTTLAEANKNPCATEKALLNVIQNDKISDEAFARSCELLKPIATCKSIDVLKEHLSSEFRAPWVCEVFRAIPSCKVDCALIEFIKNNDNKQSACAISTLALRNQKDTPIAWSTSIYNQKTLKRDKIFDVVKSGLDKNDVARKITIKSLGFFANCKSVELLNDVIDDASDKARPAKISSKYAMTKIGKDICKADEKKFAIQSLCAIARTAILDGNKKLAEKALEKVPTDCTYAIAIRAVLSDNPTKYLDNFILKNSPNMKYAARSMNDIRTFENSKDVLDNFEKLSNTAKLYVIGTMLFTGDKRFYKYVAPYIDSNDWDLKTEAIYAARFICDDSASFEKIYNLCSFRDFDGVDHNKTVWSVPTFDSEKFLKSLAVSVLEETDSKALEEMLQKKSANGDINATAWLAIRGDKSAFKTLLDKFVAGEFKNKDVRDALAKSIRFGQLKCLAKNMTKQGKTELDQAIANIIVEKFAKSQDVVFKERELDCLLWGKLDFESALYKSMCKKLRISKARKVGVQLSTFYNRSFVDCLPYLKKTGISHIGLTGQMTGGKYPNIKTGHNMNAEQRTYLRQVLEDNRLVIVSYGVRSPKTEEEIVEICEFVKEFSIPVVLTESPENMFPVWDKYAGKYGIKVAIHNHPQPDGSDYKYCYPDYVDSKIRHLPNMYSCADNGHWERDGIKTLDALKKLESKIGILHIKDVDKFGTDSAKDVQIGTGIGKVAEVIAELDRQNFDGYFLIEHEVWEFTSPEKQIEEIIENAKFIKSIKKAKK